MKTATLLIQEDTVLSLGQVAEELRTTTDALAGKAIRRFLRQEAEQKIHSEEQYFRARHAQLLEQYAGQFIAMHNGQVIDTDNDELSLYLRIRARFPMVGILIKQVISTPETIWVMRSPRLEYD